MPGSASTVREGEVLALAREMIRIPSVFRHEKEMSDHVFEKLEGWGLGPARVPVEGHGACVVAEAGDPDKPSIIFNGHMDTVDVVNGWVHDPFGAVVEEGRLYGLGSLDMKSGLAAMMVAFRALAESGTLGDHRLVLQAVTGEEETGAGTRELVAKGHLAGASCVIVGEGFGGLRAITNARRGGSYYDIQVTGRSAHGATPHLGVNAIADASRIVCALDGMELASSDGLTSDHFYPLGESQTVLKISGGGTSLSVPERCDVRLIRCTVPGGRIDISSELESLIAGLGLESSAEVVFQDRPEDLYRPYLTDPSSPLVEAASTVLERLTGETPSLVCGVSEADDNIIAEAARVPVICVGPGESGELARYHRPEECITVAQLDHAARAYCEIAEELDRRARGERPAQ